MKGINIVKKSSSVQLLLAGTLLLFTGCSTDRQDTPGYLADTPVKDIRIACDGCLPGGMTVVNVATNVNKIDVLSVQIVALVPAASWFASDDAKVYNYRFRWFDEAGFEVEPSSAVWREKIVYPGERAVFTGVAPSPAAVDFLFDIREK